MTAGSAVLRRRLTSPTTWVWVLGGLVAVLAAALPLMSMLARQSPLSSAGSGVPLLGPAFGLVGFVVAWRRPGNPMLKWLVGGSAVAIAGAALAILSTLIPPGFAHAATRSGLPGFSRSTGHATTPRALSPRSAHCCRAR